jgi:hypothetical protein
MTKPRIAPKATYENTLLDAARTVARLQAKRRRYRKLLREIDAELRHARKMLRALANRNDDRRPDIAPSRLTNGATGYVAARHLASCVLINGIWCCAADCPHHVIVDVDAAPLEPFDIGDPLEEKP